MTEAPAMLDLTRSWFGYLSLVIFVTAYLFVIFEEATQLRKSKPVLLAAGLIWALIGMAYTAAGQQELANLAAQHTIFEYGELFLFLLVAITYVNTLEERRVFSVLCMKLTARGFSYRQLFWLTGLAAFLLSPVLDNLTTALVMGAVVLAVGAGNMAFVAIACVNIVVAANAGGAFSPFGDITTLMVWQKGKLEFFEFFVLFVPSLVNWLVPALLMHLAVPLDAPKPVVEKLHMKPGAWGVILLFALTIATSVSFKNFLGLQPALGMMLGLGYLQIWSYMLQQRGRRSENTDMVLNSFQQIARVEWDTLLFFFGIIFAVGGLGVLGYLTLVNETLYAQWGATVANISIGVLSAIVDNIPLMFAVLTMNPDMPDWQWLLITLTTGVGGSLLSIGSAAGVALMGLAHGKYTFSSHLKWSWAVALGYAASIATHYALNAS
jgi:Na+/H+ antiporter NhaD/arsenite permease-like protein